MKKISAMILLGLSFILLLCACGAKQQNTETGAEKLVFAHQYGMAYAPLQVMKEQKLIEKYYGKPIEVTWQVISSGTAINEGLVSGSIDVGAVGIAPAIVGISRGVPYKIFSAVSSQPHILMTRNPEIKSLKDITPETKIALVNLNSMQHILLSMAAKEELGNAHALDGNIIAMSHPDGATAIISGTVDCQLTSSPYIFKEREQGIGEIDSIAKIWPNGNSFIVGITSQKLHDEKPELYDAIVKAMAEAIDFINEKPQDAAAMLCEAEGVSADTMLEWLRDTGCGFSPDTKGLMQMAQFMAENGFIDKMPEAYSDLTFNNVKGD